jgi:23S rRNA-/tRNA-specific pseudouridylate synthase
LIFARTAEVAKSLSTLFQTEGGIVKRYVALVTPPLTEHLKQGESKTIVSGLVKHGEVGNEKMKMVPWKESFLDQSFNDVKKAITKVTVLKNRKLASLVCLEPITGRTHQLRVHMNTLHSFILGDYRYGVGCTKQFSVIIY